MNETDQDTKKAKKQLFAERLRRKVRIARFNGTVIIQSGQQWHDMGSERFAAACYEEFGDSISKSLITDLEHLFRTTADDLSTRSNMILFQDRVWNSKKVDWDPLFPGEDCVYGVPYVPREAQERIPFIMDLACGNEGVYDDIMQSVAPLLLDKKPTGVIWYLGNGSNGKSSLVHLLYIIFGAYLTEVTVKQLEDERDAPQLNGKIGNICKESSEAFIKDTRTYKSIGTHESFLVHKFHSQEMTSVNGNVHHIFSANNIPIFADKSEGAKRRTLIIPFNNRFDSDEGFEDRTFTAEFIETFLGEMIKYAKKLKNNNYSYEFSEVSKSVKAQYDLDSNTSATYADEIMAEGVVAFTNYRHLFLDYDNWCVDNGYSSSTVNVFRRAIKDKGFSRLAKKVNGAVHQIYFLDFAVNRQVKKLSENRPGLLVLDGDAEDMFSQDGE